MSRALGRYELLRPLARGGMGEVYLARRRTAGVEKWLVVKRMRPERSGDTRFLDQFMREARLSMSLAHQNIVPVFDFGRIDDQVFLAMERVEGKDLGSSLHRSGTGLPPLLAAFVAAECLQALDYAHRRKGPDGTALGIVHRDVTPRNVLLSWAGEVKLTDFGIAVLAGDSPGRAAGTPAYMAPEQARGEELDVRADVYAVGLVLRESLLGQRARSGNDRNSMLEIAKTGQLDPLPDGFDSPLREIVERATSIDRTARFADARTMLQELDTFIVAERAANKGDAPARQLAAWLAGVWADAREDEGAIDAQIEAGVLVSFLDDGGLDVLGTGTQRSLLATAADEGPPTVEISEKSAMPATPVPGRPGEQDASAAPTETRPTEAAPTPNARRTRDTVLALLGVAAVAGAAVWYVTRDDSTRRTVAPPFADAAIAAIAEAPIDAAPLVAEASPDAAVAEMQPDAAVAETRPDAAVPHPRPRRLVRAGRDTPAKVGSGSAAVAPQPVAAPRKVTINSKPWSNWTVDGGAPHSGYATVELTPGPHTIHFTGNPYFKADKKVTITVPDKDGFTYVETLEPAAGTP